MSNKTQLSTNNTQLASLIQTLQGKAAGGGGSSVETCTVQIAPMGPSMANTTRELIYVNESGVAQKVVFTWNTAYTTIKNSFVCLTNSSPYITDGMNTNATYWTADDQMYVFQVTGDAVINSD